MSSRTSANNAQKQWNEKDWTLTMFIVVVCMLVLGAFFLNAAIDLNKNVELAGETPWVAISYALSAACMLTALVFGTLATYKLRHMRHHQ